MGMLALASEFARTDRPGQPEEREPPHPAPKDIAMTVPIPATTAAAARPAWPAGDTIAYGAVHLDVTDLDRAAAFWRDTIGLHELGASAELVVLGVPGRELVVLHAGATRPAAPGNAGLYHVAIHLPDAREFARVVARLSHLRIPQSPTDHIFTQATYVRDPDGLMLELTLETPERYGSIEVADGQVVLIDSDGRRRGGSEPLDVARVLAALDGPIAAPLPAGTFVGHVHLHVADLAGAYRYYADVVGFSEHALMTPIGMADLGAGGTSPHRIALNDWHGAGARQPASGTAGMRHFELLVPSREVLNALASRAEVAIGDDETLRLRDPAGNAFDVTAADGATS